MKKILINENPWQTRIAITRNGDLENIYFSSDSQETLERAFFRGIVTKVLPGIQTAFVDIGQERAGFLHISEIDRELAIERMSKTIEIEGEASSEAPRQKVPRPQADIGKILREGEPVLVQVSKEPVYEKGAKLTTCFTLPGRFIVLMPNIPRIGISKKIDDRDERNRLREIVQNSLPAGMGCIIRTTSDKRQAHEISEDISFLVNTWNSIQAKFSKGQPAERLYDDIALPLQIVRDHLDSDVEAVIIDDKKSFNDTYGFVSSVAPEYKARIHFYKQQTPLFQYYDVEQQIEMALEKKVHLKSGGSLIIETTEAMTVVDVNTGKFVGKKSLENTIFKTNLEAAEEIVRQLRLRNIGGLIVIDFIDMGIAANRQKLFHYFEKTLREQDKFQSVVLKISEFGLVQMTRKRSGKTLIQQLTDSCATCKGLGFTKSSQTIAHKILRDIKTAVMEGSEKSVNVRVNTDLFEYITSVEYNAILSLERMFGVKISFQADKRLDTPTYKIEKK